MQMLPVENLEGRQMWDTGDLCRRKTPTNVDLNRNYPFAWKNEVGRLGCGGGGAGGA